MPDDELGAPAEERLRLFASAEPALTQEMLALFDQAGFPATLAEAPSEPQRSSELEAHAASEDQTDLSAASPEAHERQGSSDLEGEAASDSETASEGPVQQDLPTTSAEAPGEPQRASEFEAQAASEEQADLSVALSEAHKPQRSSDPEGQVASDSEAEAVSEGAFQQASPKASAEAPCEPRALSGPQCQVLSEGARQQGSSPVERTGILRTFLSTTSGRPAVRIAAVGTLVRGFIYVLDPSR